MARPRLWRTRTCSEPPARPSRRYSLPIEGVDGGVLRFSAPRFHPIAKSEEVWGRYVTGAFEIGGRTVGDIRFRELDCDPFASNEEISLALDANSHEDMMIAELLCDCWEDVGDVFGYGTVVAIENLWLEPRALDTAGAVGVIERLLSGPLRRHALLIMKAFPAEYGGKAPDDSPFRAAFETRRRAMYRLYGRALSAQLFPGPWGDDGWLYRKHERLASHFFDPRPDQTTSTLAFRFDQGDPPPSSAD